MQKNKNHHLERQSMTRLGDGRDFASGVAQNSHPEGALMRPCDGFVCFLVWFFLFAFAYFICFVI